MLGTSGRRKRSPARRGIRTASNDDQLDETRSLQIAHLRTGTWPSRHDPTSRGSRGPSGLTPSGQSHGWLHEQWQTNADAPSQSRVRPRTLPLRAAS